MADQKVSALTANTTPTTDDLLYLVDDPGGSPTSKKTTVGDLFNVLTGRLIAYKSYAPATSTTVSTTSTTLAAIDGTNLILTFTAPASGNVIGILNAYADISSNAQQYFWAILDGSNALISGSGGGAIRDTDGAPACTRFAITGLTPGTSYTWKWAHGVTGGATGRIIYGPGVTSTTVSTSNMMMPAIMEVWSAP